MKIHLSIKIIIFLLFLFFPFFIAYPIHASTGIDGRIHWTFLLIGLMGGLAFFLYGMEKMSEGLKKSSGDHLRTILASLTKNRVIAVFIGAFVTMVIQSSSATTVMLVGFVQSGLMYFAQTLGVILGADIGTTVTAQMIAFKFTDYALLMLALGFCMRMFGKSDYFRNIGEIVFGFGILFYGMKLMSDSMKPLGEYKTFIDLMKNLENPVTGLLTGACITAVIQSSGAFSGIVIVIAQQGFINLEEAIPLILGTNIGTCITAGLASIGTSRDAKRVALAHVIFKIAGVLLFITWIPDFAFMIQILASKFDSDISRQIANAHTIFNVGLAFLFLPFTNVFAEIIKKILPDKPEKTDKLFFKSNLDENFIKTPPLAMDMVRAEISRMAEILEQSLLSIKELFISVQKMPGNGNGYIKDKFRNSIVLFEDIETREKNIDFLEGEIGRYLSKIARQELTQNQTVEVYGMMSIAKDMESIGDLIVRNIVPLIPKKKALRLDFSSEGREELIIYYQKACNQTRLLKEAFGEMDLNKAREIMGKERKYIDLESQYRIKHLERLIHEKTESVETHEIHMELMDSMKQIIVYSSNIAKTFVFAYGHIKSRSSIS